jgi:hypothetical protein
MKEWFVAKEYGYGWRPASPQAWFCVAIVFVDIILNGILVTRYPTKEIALLSMSQILIAVALLFAISYATGPSPKWRWGKQSTDKVNIRKKK